MPASRDIWQIYHLPLPPSPWLVSAVGLTGLPLSCNETESKKSSRYGLIGGWYGRARAGKQTQQNTTIRQTDLQSHCRTSHLATATATASLAWQGKGWIIHLSPGPGTDYHLVQFWSHCIHSSPFRLGFRIINSLFHPLHSEVFKQKKNHISHRQGC